MRPAGTEESQEEDADDVTAVLDQDPGAGDGDLFSEGGNVDCGGDGGDGCSAEC